jgi:hypothetical protein
MNTKIDIKSAVIGLISGVLVTLGIGAAALPGPIGRYQVAGVGNHGVIIDTATGQAWRGYFSTSVGSTDEGFSGVKNGEKR